MIYEYLSSFLFSVSLLLKEVNSVLMIMLILRNMDSIIHAEPHNDALQIHQ